MFHINKCLYLTGVEINSDGRVTKINLGGKSMTGKIPDLSSLSLLEELDLRSNQLTGPINPEFFPASLLELQLSTNTFSGSIPESIGTLTNLQLLRIAYANITGTSYIYYISYSKFYIIYMLFFF